MNHTDEKRKVVHATVCAPAAESLRAFCIGHGVTITAFLDGLGHMLCPHRDVTFPELEKAMPAIAAALMLARKIDAGRRSREPRQFKQGGGSSGGADGNTVTSSPS
jgi:hypothetical protein